MASLPPGFMDLYVARQSPDNTRVNIIGVVTDVMDPARTRTSQHMLTFKLIDRRLSNAVDGGEGLKVRFFSPNLDSLPKVRDVGDVVLLRTVNMMTVNGERVALSNYSSGVLVFPSAAIPNPNFSIAYQDKNRLECHGVPLQVSRLKLAEQNYVVHLKSEMAVAVEDSRHRHSATKRRVEVEGSASEPPSKKRKFGNSIGQKFKLIRELRDMGYADIVGLVVKRIGAQYGCDLYITDYTYNEMMRPYPAPEEQTDLGRDGDAFGYTKGSKKPWPGPYGHTILKVNVKPPHADYAISSVDEGDLVLLRNVKTRITTWGDHGLFLEGDMWQDHQSQQQINIRKNLDMESPEVGALMLRKEQYWKEREKKSGERPAEEAMTKRQKKAEKKAEKKAKKAQRQAQDPRNDSEAEQEASKEVDRTFEKNPHVRCSYEEVPVSSVRKILDPENVEHEHDTPNGNSDVLPFINAKYRARVRVVDYEPKSLEEFAVPVLAEDDGKSVDSMAWQYEGTPKHEWHFSLLLEDASRRTAGGSEGDRIWVQVHHEQAQFLLGNGVDDPQDLRHDYRLLAKLKEKMFVLWGNLEEKDEQEQLSNLPFECCIMEYGVDVDEDAARCGNQPERWQRTYALFGATIL
ncbi:telomere-binding alpha subunit central domain-containing [Lecanosticta acicola]|uniref:Protection of telomeres protein 1 n=1 Tax=Lecanosticta acicola TaxID=111012 RepID=A0AAI8YS32_9PEZI|nr:telomere-binding alpha subunit central domain-containing [Lecanosticta acicola]